jgi:thioredoxin reductase (NADPH)
MANVIVIGDGPGGLSAALFLAKGGQSVVVFGQDKTVMHYALIKNYLGVPEILGSDFQALARKQAAAFGAELREARVESIARAGDGYRVTTDAGEAHEAKYLILSEGKGPRLAGQLGLEYDAARGIVTDRNGKTQLDGVYVVGRSARPGRSQAIISAGDGAAAAIDILSRERGEDVVDWDEPPKAETLRLRRGRAARSEYAAARRFATGEYDKIKAGRFATGRIRQMSDGGGRRPRVTFERTLSQAPLSLSAARSAHC